MRVFDEQYAQLRDGAAGKQEGTKCEEFPGGESNCVVNESTGLPTGKVSHRIYETNPCTRPCVEKHEEVHVNQLKTFCPRLRDCYLAADKGKRDPSECARMGMFAGKDLECAAYKVSERCMESRLANAKACKSKENKAYGARKLASEKCFREKACATTGTKGKS